MLPFGGAAVYGFALMSPVARNRLLLGVSVLLILGVALLPEIPQDPAYLEAIARSATQVRLGEGDSRSMTLTSTKGPA